MVNESIAGHRGEGNNSETGLDLVEPEKENVKNRSVELKLRLLGIEREATSRKLASIRKYTDELENELNSLNLRYAELQRIDQI